MTHDCGLVMACGCRTFATGERIYCHRCVEVAVTQARVEERERCARIAEDWRVDQPDRVCCMARHEKIATAIRATPTSNQAT